MAVIMVRCVLVKDGLWVEGLAVNKIAAIIASINVRKMMASCH